MLDAKPLPTGGSAGPADVDWSDLGSVARWAFSPCRFVAWVGCDAPAAICQRCRFRDSLHAQLEARRKERPA